MALGQHYDAWCKQPLSNGCCKVQLNLWQSGHGYGGVKVVYVIHPEQCLGLGLLLH